MSIDPKYAIKKDIRNNPVLRETDTRQKREFLRILLLVVLSVAALLFSAKWATEMRIAKYSLEDLRQAVEAEQAANRKLRLNLETLRAPQAIEGRAEAIGLRAPTLEETVVIELTHEASPSGTIVAQAR
jgi:hypothetical protein